MWNICNHEKHVKCEKKRKRQKKTSQELRQLAFTIFCQLIFNVCPACPVCPVCPVRINGGYLMFMGVILVTMWAILVVCRYRAVCKAEERQWADLF